MSREPRGGAERRTVPSLVAMLDDVTAWRERVGREIEAGLALVGEEERQLRAVLDEGRRRFAALGSIRREQEERLSQLEDEAQKRRRAGVRQSLHADRELVVERAAGLAALVARRDAELGAGLDDPALADACLEFLEARDQAAALAGPLAVEPEQLVSERTRTLLRRYLEAAAAPLPRLPAPRRGVGVLLSADPPAGRPEALVVVLPVPHAVYAEGPARGEDLCSHLAYRVLAGVCHLLRDLGAADAPLGYAELHGNLVLQVWLGDHPIEGDLRERALARMTSAVQGAPELAAGGLDVHPVWLPADLLVEAH